MNRFSRTILGFHGCRKSFAASILDGTTPITEWTESDHRSDWLGRGIYFWEHAPERATRWATAKYREDAGLIGAVIDLRRCFDLTDVRFVDMLTKTHASVKEAFQSQGKELPRNLPARGDAQDTDLKNRQLDCLIINATLDLLEGHEPYQTVRSAFMEGGEAYEGAMIMRESHLQVAVRDRSCIIGVFRPILTT